MLDILKFSIFENVQQAKILLDKIGVDHTTNADFKKLRELLRGSEGYMGWFTKALFVEKVPFSEIERIYGIIKNERGVISNFETPITQLENTEKFWDEYLKTKNKSSIRSVWQELPSEQKKFVDLSDEKSTQMLSDLSNNKERDLFLSKVSRYHTKDEFISALSSFLYNKISSAFKDLILSLEKDGVDITHQSGENNIIVCTVDYQQIKKFASDTSWCIVSSANMFKSYTIEPLSRQFIIFLTDKTDNYSKIGVTTNIYGYRTAHLKNDAYFSFKDLASLLESRECPIGSILPNREAILKSKVSFSKIPVKILLGVGFTKEEIVKKKASYGGYSHGSFNDLGCFTKQEIEKWKLLDKTALKIGDLKSFSKEDIIKKNLFGRLQDEDISLSNIASLGFDFEEIKGICKTHKDLSFEEKSENIAKLILTMTREKAIRLASDTFLSNLTDLHRDEYRRSSDYQELRRDYRDILISVVRPTDREISVERMIDLLDLSSSTVVGVLDKLKSLSYKIDKDVVKKAAMNGAHNTSKYIKRIVKLVKSSYGDLALLLLKESISRHTGGDSRNSFDFNYTDFAEFKTSLSENIKIYDSILDLTKKDLLKSTSWSNRLSELRINVRDRNDVKLNVGETIKNLEFFKAHEVVRLRDLGHIFYNSESSYPGESLGKVIKYCRSNGYDISGPDGSELMWKCMSHISDVGGKFRFYQYLIKNKIDVDNSYRKVVDLARESKGLRSWDLSTVKEILKGKKYSTIVSDIEDQSILSEAISETTKKSGWRASSYMGYNKDAKWDENGNISKNWYENQWPVLKTRDFDKISSAGWSDDSLLISCLILLARSGKISEIADAKMTMWPARVSEISKMLAEKKISNRRSLWPKIKDEEKQAIYEFLDRRVIQKVGNPNTRSGDWTSRDNLNVLRQMAVAWYLFDRSKLDQFIDIVKNLRGNYKYTGKDNVEKYKTLRLYELDILLGYLAEEDLYKDIESILSKFSSIPKKEKADARKIMASPFKWFFNSKKVREGGSTDDVKAKYNKAILKYLGESVYNWIEFNSVNESSQSDDRFKDHFWDLIDAGIRYQYANVEIGESENVPAIYLSMGNEAFQGMMLKSPTRSFKVEISNVLDRIEESDNISFHREVLGYNLMLIEETAYLKFQKMAKEKFDSGQIPDRDRYSSFWQWFPGFEQQECWSIYQTYFM